MPVDTSQLMVGRRVVAAKIIKQPGRRRLNAHYRPIPRQISRRRISASAPEQWLSLQHNWTAAGGGTFMSNHRNDEPNAADQAASIWLAAKPKYVSGGVALTG